MANAATATAAISTEEEVFIGCPSKETPAAEAHANAPFSIQAGAECQAQSTPTLPHCFDFGQVSADCGARARARLFPRGSIRSPCPRCRSRKRSTPDCPPLPPCAWPETDSVPVDIRVHKENSPDIAGLLEIRPHKRPCGRTQPMTSPSPSPRCRTAFGVLPSHIWYMEMNHIAAKLTPCTAPAPMVTQANGW